MTLSYWNYYPVPNRRGGRNKQGGWQISAKIINGEVGKNLKKTDKSTAIRNFIEIKSSNDIVKISTKKHKKYKGSLSTGRITCSFTRFSSSRYVVLHCNQKTILCDVEETTCKTTSSVTLPRLHATTVDRAHELINGESGIKGEASNILQN